MSDSLTLSSLRSTLGVGWLITMFGVAYIISQVSIIQILGPIEEAMILLQVSGISADDYLAVFKSWDESGEMAFYRAHFILDDVHWIWYAGLFTTALCRLFDKHDVSARFNWLLLLPLASGLLDWYENQLQHVFLSAPDYSTIIDPLPLMSTVASDTKWLLSVIYIGITLVLLLRRAPTKIPSAE